MRWLLLVVGLLACGGGSTAFRTARYDAERAEVFRLAREAVAEKRAIATEDAASGTLRTVPEEVTLFGPKRERSVKRASFVVQMVGARPWQVEVRGIVEGEDEAAPTPSYLASSVDRIRARIHDKLAAFAR